MIEEIEEIFKNLLQKQVSIIIKNKTVKRGRLLIFRNVGCFIRLELMGTKREHIEIPFPYAIDLNNDEICFDYRLITLADGDQKVLNLLQKQKQVKDSKFYDRILTIIIHNGN